jgi:dTDP-4-amino-4,6-dideoxygalactose transaminase
MKGTTEQIPILDLSPEIERFGNEFTAAFQRVMRSGHFIMGPEVRAFEQEVAAYLGVKHAIGVNSGTDALVIALRSVGVGAGDEVITTPFTFFATAEAGSLLGATPVFVDIDPHTLNMNVAEIEGKITEKTKAIIPVHLYGQAVQMDDVLELAERYHLRVVEDVAQAFGGEYRGKKLGTLGDAGCYSFFPSKNLGGFGDGGLLTTNDDEIAEMAKMLRVHGSKKKYFNEVVGYNSRLDEVQAAILRVKLHHIEEMNEGRRRVAERYEELLRDVPGVETSSVLPEVKHVYHQYTVRVKAGQRDFLQEKLAARGISTMVYYPVPVHRLPIYADLQVKLPEAEAAATEVISLPIWPQMPAEVQERVVATMRDCLS